MEYFIYNNTDYTVSVPDVHYNSTFEAGAGGSIGTTNVFRIEPHSWNTTRRCKSDEVENSIAGGILFNSSRKGNITICTREEYEVKTREQASNRLESSMGISGQEKEAQQGFGFLNKVVKKSATPSIDISDFIVNDEVEAVEPESVEPEVVEVTDPKVDSRFLALEDQVASMKGALDNIAALLQAKKAPKKTKKSVKKVAKPKKTVTKKTNVQSKHRK